MSSRFGASATSSPMRSGFGRHGGDRPQWWPENEAWPPRGGPGSEAWRGYGRRFVRGAVLFMLGVVIVPLIVGVLLAVTIGGWESVALAVVVLAGLAIVAVVALRAAFRNLGPVRELIEATGRLADGDHTARVSDSRRAMQPVVTSFNAMAERLETAERQRRRLMADLGHELRTPLTVIRGEVESFIDGVHEPTPERLEEVLADIGVIERLIADLETLSTSEAGQLALHPEPTDLVELAESVVHNFAHTAPPVRLSAEAAHVDVDVDPVRIREVLANLIGNARRATPDDGSVTVVVSSSTEGPTMTVADTGAGIEPDELESVFDRFHKGADSDGSGLGLTISRQLVEAHGGKIGIESTPGEGTVVRVQLPPNGGDAPS